MLLGNFFFPSSQFFLARFLSGIFFNEICFIADVAHNWLTCFPLSAKKHVYDVFFVDGLSTEVVQVLVPCLEPSGRDLHDVNAVQSNVER